MWVYEQQTGRLSHGQALVGLGYSGHGAGRDQASFQRKADQGPIPCGLYLIGPPQDTQTHGPYVLALTPSPDTPMYGRSGFLMHGDSTAHAGQASLGCIVLARVVREQVGTSNDRQLLVVSGL